MQRIDLNDLPLWCSHTARLLNGPTRSQPDRTPDEVLKNYEQVYVKCLEFVEQSGAGTTVAEVRHFQNELQFSAGRHETQSRCKSGGKQVCISLGSELYEIDEQAGEEMMFSMMTETMADAVSKSATIVELGAGYGYFLDRLRQHFDGKRVCGADFSPTAVEIARRALANDPATSFHHFDLCDAATYGFLDHEEPPFVIFTHHAVSQVCKSAPMLDALANYGRRIQAVFFFEPLYEPEDPTLLGILRRRYLESAGYNRDLWVELERRDDLRVLDKRMHIFGANPICPVSMVHWNFRS